MKYTGSCHCGNIQYEVEGDFTEAMECNCSICSSKGYIMAFVPRESLQASEPKDGMSTYTFNKHNIQHHFCPTCGCAPYGEGSDGQGNVMAAINLRCIADIDLTAIKINHYDGKNA